MKYLLLLFLLIIIGNCISAEQNISKLNGYDGEPNIAVNPLNPDNIISAWMRMRLDGKVWIAVRASSDGGASWSNINYMPHDTLINGSADVSVAFNKKGVAFLSYINYRTAPDTAGADYVVSSFDGGFKWSEPVKVFDSREKPDLPIDRPWIAIDNSGGLDDGTIYLTSMSAYWYLGQHHIYMKYSTDNGKTWSYINQVDNPEYSVGLMTKSAGQISVGGDGTVYIAHYSLDTTTAKLLRIYLAATKDKGNSFQRSVITNVIITHINKTGDFTKSLSVSASPVRNGIVLCTWIDERYGDADVFLKKSTDYGQTWTLPLRVNDDSLRNGIEQDEVWMNYSPGGTLAIAWRDRRLSGKGDTVNFNLFSTLSNDDGDNLFPNKILSSVSSPFIKLTKGNSFIGVALSDYRLHVNWADLRTGDIEIFYNNIDFTTNVTETHVPDDGITLFPNPACSYLIIKSSGRTMPEDNFRLEILNIRGEIMKQTYFSAGQTTQIDISDLPNGLYVARFGNKNEYTIKKFEVLK